MIAPEAFCPAAEEPVPPVTLPFSGDGLSSFDLRFSGRGGKNAPVFGDGEEVFELEFVVDVPLEELLVDEEVELVVAVAVPVVPVVRPPRPLLPPFLSLLLTELRVSRPFGVLESKSSVGESHNLKKNGCLTLFKKHPNRNLPWWSPIVPCAIQQCSYVSFSSPSHIYNKDS